MVEQLPESGGLPLLQYVVKYEQRDVSNSLKSFSVPGRRNKIDELKHLLNFSFIK
jgi:hypothetical protein